MPAYSSWFFLFIVIVIIFMQRKRRITIAAAVKKHLSKKGGKNNMSDIISRYLNKRVIIYTISNENGEVGVITEIKDNWVVLNCSGTDQIFNSEYITRIKEYPEKAKKKSGSAG
ncbi:MAG: hypothetical protein ACI4KF_05940 [Huintestinicola sp.]